MESCTSLQSPWFLLYSGLYSGLYCLSFLFWCTELALHVQALRPGGRLLVRDHGLYDLTQLRLPPQQRLAQNLYRRLDGTLCYFFRYGVFKLSLLHISPLL